MQKNMPDDSGWRQQHAQVKLPLAFRQGVQSSFQPQQRRSQQREEQTIQGADFPDWTF